MSAITTAAVLDLPVAPALGLPPDSQPVAEPAQILLAQSPLHSLVVVAPRDWRAWDVAMYVAFAAGSVIGLIVEFS